MTSQRCPDCDAVLVGKTCVICGGKPTAEVAQAKIPICVRCRIEVANANALYTICDGCKAEDLHELQIRTGAPHLPRTGTGELISGLAQRFSLKEAGPYQGSADQDVRIKRHVERLRARGLDETAARRIAEDLVADPAHREGCSICGNLKSP